MFCLPLIITSACFFVPSLIGLKKRHHSDAVATGILACTSLWFHSTRSLASFVIDKTYAHSFAIRYTVKAITRCIRKHRVCDFAVCSLTGCSIYCYYREGDSLDIPLHIVVHVSSIVAFSLYMITHDA